MSYVMTIYWEHIKIPKIPSQKKKGGEKEREKIKTPKISIALRLV